MTLNFLKNLITTIDNVQFLAFPVVCAACNKVLFKNEDAICTRCLQSLPLSYYYLNENNLLAKVFWGRIKLEFATSHYVFKKNTKIQQLLHSIKYDNRKDAAFAIGKLIGRELIKLNNFSDVDYVFPIPLHPAKKAKRGYNQSAFICNGIANISGKNTSENFLIRVLNTESQTKKNKFERWENMKYGFAVNDADMLQNKHILLVDDVVTTGATIEGCAIQLQKISGVKISVASIAYSL